MADQQEEALPEGTPDGVRQRLSQMAQQRRDALEQAQAAQARATELEQQLAQERAGRQDVAERLELARTGLLDDEAVDVARVLYQRLPEDARPKDGGLPAWLRQALSAEGGPPRALAPYLQPPAQAQAASAPAPAEPPQRQQAPVAPATPPAAAAPPAPRAAPALPPMQQPASGSGQVTAEQLRVARETGQRTGDWSSFNALASRLRG